MRSTIVLHHVRVVYGDVRGTLLKIGHRVAADAHELGDQGISLPDCILGVIHEVRLRITPLKGEAIELLASERPNVQFIHPASASRQLVR